MPDDDAKVLSFGNLTEFFRESLQQALAHQHIEVEAHTEHYVVNLLTLFARAERLYADLPAGRRMPPLAPLLAAALNASTQVEREQRLQQLGDISLFFAGFFADGFARRLVDVDYHIALGGRAYGSLADSVQRGPRRALARVFAELAAKFQPLVDALGEISDLARHGSPRDVLRLYEIWQKTGSARALHLLRALGVLPTRTSFSTQ
ncbi:MAG: hypothetical protein QM718_07930 [Steroidobacteraceae bacterium]